VKDDREQIETNNGSAGGIAHNPTDVDVMFILCKKSRERERDEEVKEKVALSAGSRSACCFNHFTSDSINLLLVFSCVTLFSVPFFWLSPPMETADVIT